MFLSSIIYLILYFECFFVHCLPFYGSFSLLFPDFSHSFRRFALFFLGALIQHNLSQPRLNSTQLNKCTNYASIKLLSLNDIVRRNLWICAICRLRSAIGRSRSAIWGSTQCATNLQIAQPSLICASIYRCRLLLIGSLK